MDYSLAVVNIVEIFAMIGVGFAAGKFGVVSEKLSSELSSLLISVILPASIFAEPVAAVVRSLGQMTTPLSMFVIGLNMAAGSLVSLFQDKDALSVSVVRLVVVPLLVFASLKLLPWRDNQEVCGVTMLLFAMPAPSLCLIFAEQYHSNTPMAVKVIFSPTLLSVITIPLILLLL